MTCPVCGLARLEGAGCCPGCGTDLTLPLPGAVVAGRYEVRALLGRGGMGAVYRSFDRVLHEEVALKVQRAEAADDPAAERRFRNEVKLARQVTHANVCRLHDGGQEGGRRWISMELVEGTTLAARLREGPLPPEQAWALALQAADGLAAVHRAGVVHRDLKPANLMVDGAGRLRLMDFGIAKPAAGGDTASGYALGSPEYMSPEQARGRATDARGDVYSFGVVLFEIFAGGVPFRADTPVATLLLHLESKPPLERLPPPLRPLLARALAKDPAVRYADGAGIAGALRAAEASPTGSPAKRRRGSSWRIAAAAAGLAAALALGLLSVRARPQTTPRAASSPPAATLVQAPSPTTPTTAPSLALDPSPASGTSLRQVPIAAAHSRDTDALAGRERVAAAATPIPLAVSPTAAPATPPPSAAAAPAEAAVAERAASDNAAVPTPVPELRATPAPNGELLVVARPWAEVTVDGIARGQTPLGRIALTPESHDVVLSHPDFQPYRRRITVRSGELVRLTVDLPADGVRRRH